MSKKYNLQLQLINLFGNNNNPLSFTEIEDGLEREFNKTSIYRQLESLQESRKLNKIVTHQGAFYELRKSDDYHLHTHCEKCNNIECVDNQAILQLNSKEGFVSKQFSLVAEGLCENCNQKET